MALGFVGLFVLVVGDFNFFLMQAVKFSCLQLLKQQQYSQ